MKNLIVRTWIGLAGLIAGTIAVFGPLLFIANELQEGESAKQYCDDISISAALGACVLVFGISTLFGIAAYRLLRRAVAPQYTTEH